MLRAVFFDLDDTLYSSTEFAWRAREQAVEAMLARGLRAGRAEVLGELREVVAEFGSNDDRHFNRLLERLPPEATAEANRQLLVTAGVIAYHETKWKELHIRPAAEDLLRFLSGTELRLGVVTAGLTGKQMEKILRLGIDRFMDARLILITDQVGMAKSNPRLYRLAAHRAGVEPGEAMHVGDNPASDVDPAKAAGLLVTWHRGSGKYAGLEPRREPDHVIQEIGELQEILTGHYGVAAPAGSRA